MALTFSPGPRFLAARRVGGASGLPPAPAGACSLRTDFQPFTRGGPVLPQLSAQQESAGKRGAAFAIGVCLWTQLLVVYVRLVRLLLFSCRFNMEECAAESGWAWPMVGLHRDKVT